MAPKKAARPAQENISLGPQVREGELVFGGRSQNFSEFEIVVPADTFP